MRPDNGYGDSLNLVGLDLSKKRRVVFFRLLLRLVKMFGMFFEIGGCFVKWNYKRINLKMDAFLGYLTRCSAFS
jgi:hypothetical protein